ncbi:MAG: hypothetical protein Q9191_004708 [Dirinaria sp. TL-2023a]
MAGVSSHPSLRRTTNTISFQPQEGPADTFQSLSPARSSKSQDCQNDWISRSGILSSDSFGETDHSITATCTGSSTNITHDRSISSTTSHTSPSSSWPKDDEPFRKVYKGSNLQTPVTIPPDPEDIEWSVPAQILLKLKKHVPQLLQSFCIVDMQQYTKPVVALTEDLLPKEDASMQGMPEFTNGEYFGEVWTIQSKKVGGRRVHHLVVSGGLIDPTGDPHAVIQCFFAILELTALVDAVRYSQCDVWSLEGPKTDIWYAVYLEDMDAAGSPVGYRPPKQEVRKVSRKDQLDIAEDLIRRIHKDYFVLQPSSVADESYQITGFSPSLLDMDIAAIPPPDFSRLSHLLKEGRKFHCEIVWGSVRRLHCLPMSGRESNCWLCFFLDRDLPAVW